jgi:hypothetical protein
MCDMADYREFFAGQFLTGPECKGCPTFRIAEVRREEVEDPEKPQQRRQKLVVYGLSLQGRERPWIVCKTSAILLAAMLGDDVDGWPGRAVTLGFDDTVTVDGKRVGGVRPIGAPDLLREMTVQVKLPRRKAKPHTLRPTGDPLAVVLNSLSATVDALAKALQDLPKPLPVPTDREGRSKLAAALGRDWSGIATKIRGSAQPLEQTQPTHEDPGAEAGEE